MPATTVYLKDYQAPHLLINKVSLHFDLHDSETLVQSSLHLSRLHAGPFVFTW